MIKAINYVFQFPVVKQLIKFGFVGGFATIVNYLAVVFFVEVFHLTPLIANVIAFLIAWQVSFRGHRYWTFRTHTVLYHKAMTRFFTLSIFSFALNETLFAFFLKVLHLHYAIALLIVLMIIPPITFVISKLWAFKA